MDGRKLFGIPLEEIDWSKWDVVFAPNKEFKQGDKVGVLIGCGSWTKHTIERKCSTNLYDTSYMVIRSDGCLCTHPSSYLLEWRAFE